MPALTTPTERVHASSLSAMAEFRAEGLGDRQDHTMVGAEIREHGGGLGARDDTVVGGRPTWTTSPHEG